MLQDANIIQNDGILDVEAVEQYIVEELRGTISQDYAETKVNITFTDGEIVDNPENNDKPKENDIYTLVCSFIEILYMLFTIVCNLIFPNSIV